MYLNKAEKILMSFRTDQQKQHISYSQDKDT